MDLNSFRGFNKQTLTVEDIWSWLFTNGDIEREVEIVAETDASQTFSLAMSLVPRSEVFVSVDDVNTTAAKAGVDRRLTMRLERGPAPPIETSVEISHEKNGLNQLKSDERPMAGATYLPAGIRMLKDDAERFGRFEGSNRERDVLEYLREIFNEIEDLALVPTADGPRIHAKTGNLSKKIPVHFLGDGPRYALSFILACMDARGGTVLIDEIENGLHYSAHERAIQVLAKVARAENTQVFATTHSYELIGAAHRALNGDGDYACFRIDASGGESRAFKFDSQDLATVLSTDLEVR